MLIYRLVTEINLILNSVNLLEIQPYPLFILFFFLTPFSHIHFIFRNSFKVFWSYKLQSYIVLDTISLQNAEFILSPQWLLLWKRGKTSKHPPTHFLTSLNDNQNCLLFCRKERKRPLGTLLCGSNILVFFFPGSTCLRPSLVLTETQLFPHSLSYQY